MLTKHYVSVFEPPRSFHETDIVQNVMQSKIDIISLIKLVQQVYMTSVTIKQHDVSFDIMRGLKIKHSLTNSALVS